jgi:hypothetical protein
MAVWKSPQMQRALESHIRGRGPFVWDGNKIGWYTCRRAAEQHARASYQARHVC